MGKPARLAREALQELAEAAEWYDSLQKGLGDRILDEVQDTLALIRERPPAFPVLQTPFKDLQIRRALLHHFPYTLVFLELATEIRVIAIAHQKRRPLYWLDRLR